MALLPKGDGKEAMNHEVIPQESKEAYEKRMLEAQKKTERCMECDGKIVVDRVVGEVVISTPCSICCAGR